MPKISVVIPVYNVEKYLPKCIDSVLNQTLSDIEIILVNDGSEDLSGEICERYAELDSRIKYICQENQGVVMTRKNGMKYVTSEYVTFIDSDDWVSESFFEELYNNINGCDLLLADHYVEKGKTITINRNAVPKGLYNTSEKMKYIIDNLLCATDPEIQAIIAIPPYIWSKLYKSEIAKETFEEIDTNLFFYEDVDFISKYILKCKSVNNSDICGYYYLERSDSCVKRIHPTFLLNLNNLYSSLIKAFKESEHSESLIKQLHHRITYILSYAPGRMGFHTECMIMRYISPFLNKIEGRKTALYGAGVVGKNYYLQMKKSKGGAPSVWVDRNYELYNNDFPVHPVEELKIADFDYIIIAVESENTAESIRQNLIGMGFDDDKILWEEPVKIYNP